MGWSISVFGGVSPGWWLGDSRCALGVGWRSTRMSRGIWGTWTVTGAGTAGRSTGGVIGRRVVGVTGGFRCGCDRSAVCVGAAVLEESGVGVCGVLEGGWRTVVR